MTSAKRTPNRSTATRRLPVVIALALLVVLPAGALVVAALRRSRADAAARPGATLEQLAAAALTDTRHSAGAPAGRSQRRLARVARAASARLAPKAMLAAAAAVAVGVLVAVTGTGGTFAYLNSQSGVGSTTVSSGSLGLTVTPAGGAASSAATVPSTAWAAMLPGDTIGQQVTLTNSGTASGDVTARIASAGTMQVRVATGACPAGQLGSTALTTTPVALSTLAGGAGVTVCVQATLPASAPASAQGAAAPFTVVFDGKQRTP